MEMKVGYTKSASSKERHKTVEKRRSYDVTKLARWNEIWSKTDFGITGIVEEETWP